MEHDADGGLGRHASRRSRRGASRNYGTLRRKPSQLATVADDESAQIGKSELQDREPVDGPSGSDPLSEYANGTEKPAPATYAGAGGAAYGHSYGGSERKSLDYHEDDDSLKGRAVVRPHPPVRWDDTPNNTARYNNPFYNQEMDDFLWLPRNPLAPIDLFDTIEWYGPALVSSQGGGGVLGDWEDEQEDDYDDEYDSDYEKNHVDDIPLGGEAATLARRSEGMLEGDEEIVLPDHLARHLEETQNVEEVADPAASVPKHLMEDYKRAIRRSERAGSVSSAGRSPSSLFRRGSDVSASSARGYGGPALLQVPSHGSWRSAEGPQAPASPTSVRASQRPGTGGSEPLASVAEAGVMIPRRSSSRRKRREESGNDAAAEDARANGDADARDEAPATVERRMSRRTRRDASGALSGFSGGTTQKTVTLKAALRAEALEEERRITLKEKLASRKGRKKANLSRDASGQLEGLEEGLTDGEEGERGIEAGTIMERYAAEHRRRATQASEFGQLTPQRAGGGMRRDASQGSALVDTSLLERSGSSAYTGKRFRTAALGVLSLSRQTKADANAAQPTSMAMQELGGAPASTAATSAAAPAIAGQGEVAPERPSGVAERSLTEVALPAEASRTTALNETVDVAESHQN